MFDEPAPMLSFSQRPRQYVAGETGTYVIMVIDLYDWVLNPQWNRPVTWLLFNLGMNYQDPRSSVVDPPLLWRVLVFRGRRTVRLSNRTAISHELFALHGQAVERAEKLRTEIMSGSPYWRHA